LNHSSDPNTLNKISSNTWDYVALQAQSQEPSWPLSQVQQDVFPHAAILCDAIRTNHACSMPVFYMTWGRKNGDASNCASWPPVCTYEGMDSLLNERYQMMADDNNALVSPVGAVWHYIRDNYPLIDLYSPDESHPSIAGTYAAACTFYTIILKKDPTQITFSGGLLPSEAASIRQAAKIIAFNDLENWNVGKYAPVANFSVDIPANSFTASFTNTSLNSDEFMWYFGDGDSTDFENPTHTYFNGIYEVSLVSKKCEEVDVKLDTVYFTVGVEEWDQVEAFLVYPNPTTNSVVINWVEMDVTSNTRVRIVSSNGEVIMEEMVAKNTLSLTLDVSGFRPGVYFVSLLNGEQINAIQKLEIVR
jgi:hypothetical protein